MFTKDNQWSRQAFLVSSDDYPDAEQYLRTFNLADLEYHDTALGGNNAINPLPQFTRYADPPIKSFLHSESTGMGGTYAEAFNNNQQVIYLRFGVPKYNSMTTFFTGFYNYRAGQVARTGRVPEGFYLLGAIGGTAAVVVGAFVFPLFTALTAGLAMFGYAARFFLNKPSSRYYYIKPTMTTYWTVAGMILNYLVINMGYLSQQADASDSTLRAGDNKGLTAAERAYMHEHLPDLFAADGFVDIYAIATRPQRLARKQEKEMSLMLEAPASSSNGSWFGRAVDATGTAIYSVVDTILGPNAVTSKAKNQVTLASYLKRWKETGQGMVEPNSMVEKDSRMPVRTTVGSASMGEGETVVAPDPKNDSWWDFLQAEWDDGGSFAAFRVDHTGSTSESFTSNTADSEIKSKFNSMSSSNRSSFFTVGGRELADIPMIGSILGMAGNAAKDVVGGIADSTGMSGLMALGGSAFIDVPKHWQDSSFSGPRMNYTMTLDALYNHPVSRIMGQYLPLAMIMAGALPLSVGKQSYTSPFICECYDRGRAASRLSIIRNLGIARGNGNLGFMNNGVCLSIDVSFDLEDLSSVMAAPLNAFYSANIIGSVFDDDTNFSDYMAVLTGMGLTDMTYPSNKVARNWSRNVINARRYASPAYWGSVFGNKMPSKIFSILYKGVDRQ